MKLSVFVYFIITSSLHLFIIWHAEIEWEIEREEVSEFILHVEHTFLLPYQNEV